MNNDDTKRRFEATAMHIIIIYVLLAVLGVIVAGCASPHQTVIERLQGGCEAKGGTWTEFGCVEIGEKDG